MVEYKCFSCKKSISAEYFRKKVRCPYCGYKVLYKERTAVSKVPAR